VQSIGLDSPVPRWSKTITSCERFARASCAAKLVANGVAPWPGPPANAKTALPLDPFAAGIRTTRRLIVPGTAPLRSIGTVTLPHWTSAPSKHGSNAMAACELAGARAQRSTSESRTARARRVTRTKLTPPGPEWVIVNEQQPRRGAPPRGRMHA
jgi:hypothetical protein